MHMVVLFIYATMVSSIRYWSTTCISTGRLKNPMECFDGRFPMKLNYTTKIIQVVMPQIEKLKSRNIHNPKAIH